MAFAKYSLSGVLAYAVPLYLSPVLSGASGAPWAIVPVFALIFVLLILRTRRMPDPDHQLTLVIGTLLVDTVLAAGLFALGRLIMLFVGPVALPLWLPLAVCPVAAGWGMWRYRWTPEADAMDAALDEALSQLQAMTPPDDPDDK